MNRSIINRIVVVTVLFTLKEFGCGQAQSRARCQNRWRQKQRRQKKRKRAEQREQEIKIHITPPTPSRTFTHSQIVEDPHRLFDSQHFQGTLDGDILGLRNGENGGDPHRPRTQSSAQRVRLHRILHSRWGWECHETHGWRADWRTGNHSGSSAHSQTSTSTSS